MLIKFRWYCKFKISLIIDDGSVDNTYQELNEHFQTCKQLSKYLQYKNNLNLDGF